MCGIVGAIAGRDIVPLLIEGLSASSTAVTIRPASPCSTADGQMRRLRTVGKVRELEDELRRSRSPGDLGIAHTRWATHGVPSERNAHPHVSRDGLAIVHNGIIENHEELRDELQGAGYKFASETDTEVIAHRIHYHCSSSATCSARCAPRSPSSKARTRSP